jgi:peptidoglycan/LPS O-acetylase OafA/YrhL
MYMTTHETALSSKFEPLATPSGRKYNLSIGYLRAFVTLLVLAHHSVLAYHPFAPPHPASLTAQPRWWLAFPVVDSQRWTGFGLLVGFNDIFFMSLMFFLSGLFVWNSLQRKRSGAFLRGRALRLGLPFLAAAAFVAPAAYYPAFLQTGARSGFAGFWKQWLSLGNWPAGPAWFVWVLLAFDCIAVLLFLAMPKWGDAIGRLASMGSRRPVAFFALLVAASAVVYIPMALIFSPLQWTAIGPFTFQTSRIFHYLVYFLIAVGIGAYGIDRGLLAPDGKLARRWPAWTFAALFFFGLAAAVMIAAATSHAGSAAWATAGDFLFTLSCAASSFACLALFIRFARTRVALFDSLRDNAYGMYLVHYAFASWLQYALLGASLPGVAKGSIVFLGTVMLSWGATAMLRRVPAIGRVI